MPSNANLKSHSLRTNETKLYIKEGEQFAIRFDQSEICAYGWISVQNVTLDAANKERHEVCGASLNRSEMVKLRDTLNNAIAAYDRHYGREG